MIFISTNSDQFPYKEAEQLYIENKQYFLPLDIPFKELCEGLNGNLWACYNDNFFIGIIYFEIINGNWFLSGFAKRKMYKYISDCIKEICKFYYKTYKIKEIFSETTHKHAKLALKRAGFFETDKKGIFKCLMNYSLRMNNL